MATIRVTCPTCGQLLEVDAEHAGEEVECGECFQVFVAEGPKPPKIQVILTHGPLPHVEGKPKSRQRRRDDDDDSEPNRPRDEYDEDDYDRPTRPGGAGAAVTTGTAVVGLVVGVFALLTSCCPVTGIVLGILAMVLGAVGKKSPDVSGAATAAAVLGSIAFVISAGLAVWLFAAGGWNRIGK